MKQRSLFFNVLVLLALIFSITTVGHAQPMPAQPAQASQGPVMCITAAPNTASFPYVTLNFRMLGENLTPIAPAETDLRFIENGQPSLPVEGSIQRDASQAGIDFRILVDVGNRTPQDYVRSILQTFASSGFVNEQNDQVKVYTDAGNGMQLYYPGGNNGNTFSEAANNYHNYGDLTYRQATQSLDTVLSELETNPDVCQKTRVIIMIMGDDALEGKSVDKFAQRIKTSLAKLAVFHLGGSFNSRGAYESLAKKSGGLYWQIKSLENDVKPELLQSFLLYKEVYSAKYRTNSGSAGSHQISATYQNANVTIKGQSSYSVDVLPPTVSLEGEAVINRKAMGKTEDGNYNYDSDSSPYTVQVTWGDSYPRKIESAALVWNENGTETQIDIPLDAIGDNLYQFNWNYSPINGSGEHTITLSVKIVDEFKYESSSPPMSVLFTNNTTEVDTNKVPTWVPTVLFILGAVVVVLLILMIFMWRKMLTLAKQGGAALGRIAGEIRKTIVGGGKRGKPLASLKVLDGPSSMIGQELKIYTESVKLGRNPQLADMTFYGPDVNTSISGLHARLEKMSGNWRIVALSQSGNETFIDEQAIPFNQPVGIRGGQKIRMGYFAQQPVVFEFMLDQVDVRKTSVETSASDPRKTDVVSLDDTQESMEFFGPGKKAQAPSRQSSETNDSVFDEFR